MKKTKKFLSLVLAVLMLLSIMPMAYAEGNTYKVGDIIQFGSYPQSEVKDESLIAELNALAPEWEEWTSYGYYSGTGSLGTMVQGDWMRYTDIEFKAEKYRGVKFTQYRPEVTDHEFPKEVYSYQYSRGYEVNTVYWFKFELIDWRVLDPTTGLVLCENIIDAQAYNNTLYCQGLGGLFDHFNDASYTVYACDYEASSIRKWLNDDFYKTAFSDIEKKEISTTFLHNSSLITMNGGPEKYEKLDSNVTYDKIFLLSASESEVRNSNYGFSDDESRRVEGSDYALCQGLNKRYHTGNSGHQKSSWILRTAGSISYNACVIFPDGRLDEIVGVNVTHTGVRPALCLKDIYNYKHTEHSYNAVVIAPTCTAQGFTTYNCECGDSYVDNYVNAKGHIDSNSDYKCDYNCGYEFEKPAKELNFFQKIIQWIKDFFSNLFGFLK